MKSSEMEKFLALAWIIFSQGRWISVDCVDTAASTLAPVPAKL